MGKPALFHMRTTQVQISTFVVRPLDSIIPVVAMYEISKLASFCCCGVWFKSYQVANPEDRFSRGVTH